VKGSTEHLALKEEGPLVSGENIAEEIVANQAVVDLVHARHELTVEEQESGANAGSRERGGGDAKEHLALTGDGRFVRGVGEEFIECVHERTRRVRLGYHGLEVANDLLGDDSEDVQQGRVDETLTRAEVAVDDAGT